MSKSTAVASFEKSRDLESRLEQLPDVRAEKVTNGRKLIEDPDYPPRELIQRIAALLGMEIEKTIQ